MKLIKFMHPDHFSLEALGDARFEGYTNGENWNGWSCPHFSFHVAQDIVKAFGEGDAYYDDEADEFVFALDGEEEAERYSSVQSEQFGKLYPIGAFNWIWEREKDAQI